jgi:hypothetical protein
MKGEKQVTFPFSFKYSEGGIFKEEFGVTIRAPSLDQFAVHTVMVAYAAESGKKNQADAMVAFGALPAATLEVMVKARGEQAEQDGPAPVETDAEMADRVIGHFASGLGSDRFPAFMAFVLKTIKNNPKLATVGDGKIPLTDATVDSIVAHGGMDALNLMMATFAGFFLQEAPSTSQKPIGDNTQASQQSAHGVH